jgi:hypothetical protein
MIGALITLLVIVLVVGLVYWVVDAMPVPQPLNKFIKIAAVVIGAIAIIYVLLGVGGFDTRLPAR